MKKSQARINSNYSQEFNLSDKIFEYGHSAGWINNRGAVHASDIKEFIRRLKEELVGYVPTIAFDKIDKLAGEKLV